MEFSFWSPNDLRLWSSFEGGKWSCTWLELGRIQIIVDTAEWVNFRFVLLWQMRPHSKNKPFFIRRLHRDDENSENRFCVPSVFALTGCGVLVIIHVQHSEKSRKKLGSARWSSSSQLSSDWTSKNCRVEGKTVCSLVTKHLVFVSDAETLFLDMTHDVPILVYLW